MSGVNIPCIENHTGNIRIKSLALILVLTELLTCVQVFMTLFAEEKATVSLWSSQMGNKKEKSKRKYFLVMPVLFIWTITGDKCVTLLGQCFLGMDFLKSFWYLNNNRFRFQRKRLLCHPNFFFCFFFFFFPLLYCQKVVPIAMNQVLW